MSICLSMIVKNEAHIIARALGSVGHMIDCWCIVDTGSTDDTEKVVKQVLRDVPGEYRHAPWEGYGPARTRALVLAAQMTCGRADHALIVDADDVWSGERPKLASDVNAYAVWFTRPGAKWTSTRLLKIGVGIQYDGVVHEMPVLDGQPVPATVLDGLTVTSPNDGASWADPKKYLEHARMIQRAMVDDPTNTRYAFYLAQSYRDHGDDERAAVLYLQRAAMGPSTEPEQVYIAFLEAGRAFWRLGKMDAAKRALLHAHGSYPGRREALAELARWFAVTAATSPTVGTLFVETGLDEAAE